MLGERWLTGPRLSLSGRLRDLKGRELFGEPYQLTATADEPAGEPGISKIEIFLDGERQGSWPSSCTTGGCAQTVSWSFDPSPEAIESGGHTIEVRATDHAGARESARWTVYKSDLDPLPTEDELFAESLAFRQERGLSTDPQLVRDVMHQHAYGASRDRYGVPLTPAELRQMDIEHELDDDIGGSEEWAEDRVWMMSEDPPEGELSRAAVEEDPDAIERYGNVHPDVYAGSFVDAGAVYVGFTDNAAQHLAALDATTDEPLGPSP